MPGSLEIRDLTVTYGATRAVDGLDLAVRSGEIVGLLGPNGAGKTSTLKVSAGLLKPASGAALISGRDIVAAPVEAKRRLAYLPDRPHLYELLSAWEYLEFAAGLWGLPSGGDWRTIAETELRRFGIWEVRDDLLESYSHGMRQKTLFIAGLIHRPEVWVMDEPMSGLDPRAARMMRDRLREETARGVAVLFSTHTLDIAERMCDRIAIIDGGRKIAEGTMDELRQRRGGDVPGKTKSETNGETRLEELFFRLTEAADESDAVRGLQ
jgi:ABC-2 type transport system ATP-binding protein